MRIYNLFLLLLICGTAISYTQIPGDGLVGYWSFNGHAYDASGFNNHGSVIGAVLTSDRFDRMYSAYYFDGNDVINVPHSESLIFEPSNSDYALSLWVQFDKSISDGGRIIQKWFGITEGSNYPFSIQANPESVGFLILSKTLNYVYYTFPTDEWYHIVYNINGSEQHKAFVWVNGELVAQHDVIAPELLNNDATIQIGGDHKSRGHTGKIDDIRIYNRYLEPDEIKSLYNENICFETISETVNIYDTITTEVFDTTFITIQDTIIREVFDTTFIVIQDTAKVVISDTTYITIHDTLTTEVFDTTFITIQDTITINEIEVTYVAVSDTLFIDAVLTGIDPPDNINTITVYPNPANNHLIIKTGDYSRMTNYQIRIINQLGVIVFETLVEELFYELNLSKWTGIGLYFLQVFDPGGDIIENKKIILQ